MQKWFFVPIGMMLLFLSVSPVRGDEWPQWRGPNRDGVWNESGIVDSFASGTIPHQWSVPVAQGYSGPTVADGRVYLMDRVTEPNPVERVLCFDWTDGHELWKYEYESKYEVDYPLGPRTSVTIDDGRAYSLGTMGHLHCFDAKTGAVIWKSDLKTEYNIPLPIWGIAASPIVFEDMVIVQIGGGGGACIVAFDKSNGSEQWRALDDPASYSSPIVIEQAGKPVLVCWTGVHLAGLDPRTGKVYWQHDFKPVQMVLNIATPVFHDYQLFVTAFYDGSLMVHADPDALSSTEVWRRRGRNEKRTDALHSIISTPVLLGDYIYGFDSYGEMRCLDAKNGDRIWEDLTVVHKARWATVHMVKHGDNVWMFNEFGELVIGKLSPQGFEEIDRAKLIEPTTKLVQRDRPICWSHPAFAYKHVFARSDKELICADLSKR